MEHRKIYLNKKGNFYSICKDKDGHELWASSSITLKPKDFKKWDNRDWTDFFDSVRLDEISKHDMMDLFYALPRVLFEKLKTTENDLFIKSKYFCLCHILINTFGVKSIEIDCEVDFFR